MKKKDIRILTIILAMPLIVGLVVAGVFQFGLEKSEWITLITSCISTFAAIFLGYMVFFQNEKHKISADEDRKQDLLIQTTPYLVFDQIEYGKSAKNSTVAISEFSPVCVRYIEDEGCYEISHEEFLCKYNHGTFFRFIFSCPADKGLNTIIFNEVSVYPNYHAYENGQSSTKYCFLNTKADVSRGNISLLGNNRYQVCKYFMFPKDKDSYDCSLAAQFENDLLKESGEIFFNIKYTAINIYGVKVLGELKFFTTACAGNEENKIAFSKPTNISNWIGELTLIEQGENK